jgi:amidase
MNPDFFLLFHAIETVLMNLRFFPLLLVLLPAACYPPKALVIPVWTPYDESQELAENAGHEIKRMQYKLIQSKVSDKNDSWKVIAPQIGDFSEKDYQELMPLIYEQNIPAIQSQIRSGKLTYEALTKWYLYRILKFENDKDKTLHTIVAINPDAVAEARKKDRQRKGDEHPIFGMPILLKDNINVAGMPTTAGAVALMGNSPGDAFIAERLRTKGAIILGKVNLSEWAYFFCSGCPVGYSAVGGQTLNPYGRRHFEPGGSSSGSGTSMAANYAVAAVGTETSGSILSPSGQNSVVGLKPTVGLLSRTGIAPISSTLDTPGPMTRNVTDNAILLSAMTGEDPADHASVETAQPVSYWEDLRSASLQGKRFGVVKAFLEDSIYRIAVEEIRSMGAETIEFEPENMSFEGFITLLSAEMKAELPKYLKTFAPAIPQKTVDDIVAFNRADSLVRAPYGQALFEGIVAEDISREELAKLWERLHWDAVQYFEKPMQAHQLDAVLSINNYNAGQAALAQYPCLTVPMGYKETGEPISLTFISRPFEEDKLLKMGFAFEQSVRARRPPAGY